MIKQNIKTVKIFIIIFILIYFLYHATQNYLTRIDIILPTECFDSNSYFVVPECRWLEFIVKVNENGNYKMEKILNYSNIVLLNIENRNKYISQEKRVKIDSSNIVLFCYKFYGVESCQSSIVLPGEYFVSFLHENFDDKYREVSYEKTIEVHIYFKQRHAIRWYDILKYKKITLIEENYRYKWQD